MRSPVASDYEDSDDWESSSPGSSGSSRGASLERRRTDRRMTKREPIDDRRRKRSRSGSSHRRRQRSPSFTESSGKDTARAEAEDDEEEGSVSRSSVADQGEEGVESEQKATEQGMNVLFANFVPIRPLNPVELTPFIVYQVFRGLGFPQRILILSDRKAASSHSTVPGEAPAAQGNSSTTNWNDDGSRLRERMDAAYRGGRGTDRNETDGAPSPAFLGPQKALIQFENKEIATRVMAALNEKVIQLAVPQPATVCNSPSGALVAKPTPPRVEFGFRLFLKPSPGDKVFVHKNTDKMFVLTPQAIPLMGPIFDRFEGDWNASDFASTRSKLGFVKPQGIHIQALPTQPLPPAPSHITASTQGPPHLSHSSIHVGLESGRSLHIAGEADWKGTQPSSGCPNRTTRPEPQHQLFVEPIVVAGHQLVKPRIASHHASGAQPPSPHDAALSTVTPPASAPPATVVAVGARRRQYVPPAPAATLPPTPVTAVTPQAPAGPEW